MLDPAKIAANGAFAGHPVEDFTPIWNCAALRIARSAWLNAGLEVFLRMDVPYGATSSGRLSDDAVQLLLEVPKRAPNHQYRFLEIGAGSGLFAKLFLDALAAQAPDIYRRCTYVVSDANAAMLESQARFGVLSAHAERIETRVFDASLNWPTDFTNRFDAVFGAYILDSLPVEILSVGERGIKRMEARCLMESADAAAPLAAALKTPGFAQLSPFLPLRKKLKIQTRHTPVQPDDLPFSHAIGPAKGEDIPMAHCHGALACMENISRSLRLQGFAMLSDYGTIAPREPSDTIEFQSFGASAAQAVNFFQLDQHFATHPEVSYLKPDTEEGHLITRLLYKGPSEDLFELVDLLFGEVRQRALRLPVDAARELLRANAFQAARRLYVKALELQPRNWSLAEEVAEHLLLAAENFEDAKALARFGLSLNPYAPNLHRIYAQACFELSDITSAKTALEKCMLYAGDTAQSHLLEAKILTQSNNFKAALTAIAQGLAADFEAEQREVLLAQQEEILRAISHQAREDLLAEVNQFCPLDGLPH